MMVKGDNVVLQQCRHNVVMVTVILEQCCNTVTVVLKQRFDSVAYMVS
jgi:hypothetical protein